MTRKILSLATAAIMACFAISAQTHVQVRGAKTIKSHPIEKLEDVTFTGENSLQQMTVKYNDGTTEYVYPADDVKSVTLGHYVPEIRINTDDPSIYDVADKVTNLPATFNMKSNGFPGAKDITNLKFNVRGRGNSSLTFPKKPYRLKFDKKQELHSDLKKAKNYVLISNYIDNAIMRTATAFTIAQLLEMPYTNHSIPVDVYFNDRYVGAYMLTEKVGLNSGHIDDIDEGEGIFFEMDTYYDEIYKFRTECYNLPMMIKDPDFDELKEDGVIKNQATYLAKWQNDWNYVERVLAGKETEGNGKVWDYIDLNALVNFLIVNNLTNNGEISHPKSNYIHKSQLGSSAKYCFGPVWDFDYSFTFFDSGEGSGTYDQNIFDDTRKKSIGSVFYRALIKYPGFSAAYKKRWEYFVKNLYPELCKRLDAYADEIEESAVTNFKLWPQKFGSNVTLDSSLNEFRNGYKVLREFLDKRVEYLSTAPNHGFFHAGT